MKKTIFPAFLLILVFALGFMACKEADEIFSTSWGESRVYDPNKINVTAANMHLWRARAIGNPALASQVNEAIDAILTAQIEAAEGNFELDEDTAVIVAGRVDLLTQDVGLTTSILANAGESLGSILGTGEGEDPDPDAILNIFLGIKSDFDSEDSNGQSGTDKANALAQLLVDTNAIDYTPGQAPELKEILGTESTQAVEIVMILALAELDLEGFDMDEPDFNDLTGRLEGIIDSGLSIVDGQVIYNKDTTAPDFNPNHLVLAAYANFILNAEDGGGMFGGLITGALGMNN